MTNPEGELVKKFISDLRDPEAKFRLLDGIKSKPMLILSEITDKLMLLNEAMAFARSSTVNKPVVVREEVGYNFKKTFSKLN